MQSAQIINFFDYKPARPEPQVRFWTVGPAAEVIALDDARKRRQDERK